MRRGTMWAVVVATMASATLFLVVVPSGSAPADAQTDIPAPIDVPAFAQVALDFVSLENVDDLIESDPVFGLMVTPVLANGDAGLYNPFKGPVTYNQATADTASISYSLALTVNLGEETIEIPYVAENLHGFGGGVHAPSAGSNQLPPLFPPGGSQTFDEFVEELLGPAGDASSTRTIVHNGIEIYIPEPEGSETSGLTPAPVYLLGARTVEPRPFGCDGFIRDSGVFFDTPIVNWDDTTGANSELFNDFFYAGDTALVANCQDGPETQTPTLRVFQGSSASPPFQDMPSNGVLISGPYGWVQIVSGAEIEGATGVRLFEFVTDLMAPYNSDYTAASVFPSDLTTMYPLSMVPHAFFDESLVLPPTTTTSSTTTTTAAAVAPPVDASTNAQPEAIVVSTDSADTPGGFPFPLLVFVGLALIALGGFFWWKSGSDVSVVNAGDGGSVLTGSAGGATMTDSPPAVLIATRPGKGVGGGGDSPPLIGLRGWKP